MKVRVLGMVLVGVAAAAMASASLIQGVKIAWNPAEGLEKKYKIKTVGKLTSPMEGEFVFTADMSTKITKVATDEITQETKTSPPVIEFNGMPIDAGVPESKSTTVSKRNGATISTVTEPAEGGADNPRIAAAQTFIYPGAEVKAGETWTHKVAKDTAKKVFDMDFTFTYVGTEKVGDADAYKITVEIAESGADTNITGSGTYWIAVADGTMLKADSKMKNVPLQEGIVATEVSTTVTPVS